MIVFGEGFEKGDDAGLCVGVVEPVCAGVGGVGGVVCEFGCVEGVPADLSVSYISKVLVMCFCLLFFCAEFRGW